MKSNILQTGSNLKVGYLADVNISTRNVTFLTYVKSHLQSSITMRVHVKGTNFILNDLHIYIDIQ